jgi:hypothetical protein
VTEVMSGQPAQAAAALDKTPRPITPRAAWRAWAEMPVQFWWKSAVIVLAIAAIVAVSELSQELKLRQLIHRSIQVKATAVEVAGVTAQRNRSFGVQRDDAVDVKLSAKLPDGRIVQLAGTLPKGQGWLKVGGDVDVYVDPNDPTQWVEVAEQRKWWELVALPMIMLLPVALLLLAFAWWRRRQILQVWRDGKAVEGSIVSCTHSPIAPRSKVCGYSVPGDRRVFKMLYPLRLGQPRVGDVVPLIVLPDRPDRAIAARAYQT